MEVKRLPTCIIVVAISFLITLDKPEETYATLTVGSREELENELKLFYGEDGPLPDFTFYSKTQLDNYTTVNKNTFNRTERPGTKKPKPKDRSDAEKIFAQALKSLRKGNFVAELNWTAQIVAFAMSGDMKTIPNGYRGRIPINKRRRYWPQRKRSTRRNRSRRRLTTGDEFFRNFERFLESVEDTVQDEIDPVELIPEEQEEDDLFDEEMDERLEEYEDDIHHEETVEEGNDDSRKYIDKLLNYDRRQMSNDGASFSYTGSETCYAEGSDASADDTIRLCATCTKQIDFGAYVSPQYANSVECVDSNLSCLTGDGTCTQKIIYYTFQYMSGLDDNGAQVWDPYQQYINTTCECECLKGSMVDTYFVQE